MAFGKVNVVNHCGSENTDTMHLTFSKSNSQS